MKFIRFDDNKLGLIAASGGGIIDLTDRLGLTSDDPLIEYLNEGLSASEYRDAPPDHGMDDVAINAPVRQPSKIIAAPANYVEHVGELEEEYRNPSRPSTVEEISYFLKSPTSLVGPTRGIELPAIDRRFDHEVELGFVMENDVKNIDYDEVWENIFGYTILLDISMRGQEDRSNRKSFDTFTPMGPYLVTRDEISDPMNLHMELRVNDETRQSDGTEKMVMDCADIVEYASIGSTIKAGDVVATGTCSGVGPIHPGDRIDCSIEEIGEMALDVGVDESAA